MSKLDDLARVLADLQENMSRATQELCDARDEVRSAKRRYVVEKVRFKNARRMVTEARKKYDAEVAERWWS